MIDETLCKSEVGFRGNQDMLMNSEADFADILHVFQASPSPVFAFQKKLPISRIGSWLQKLILLTLRVFPSMSPPFETFKNFPICKIFEEWLLRDKFTTVLLEYLHALILCKEDPVIPFHAGVDCWLRIKFFNFFKNIWNSNFWYYLRFQIFLKNALNRVQTSLVLVMWFLRFILLEKV